MYLSVLKEKSVSCLISHEKTCLYALDKPKTTAGRVIKNNWLVNRPGTYQGWVTIRSGKECSNCFTR